MARARPGSQVSPLWSCVAVTERLQPGAEPPAAWLPAPCAPLAARGLPDGVSCAVVRRRGTKYN